MAHRVGRGIALLFHDRGTRRGWVVSSTPRPHFTPGEEPVPILQEAGWAPGPVWTCGKSRPHRDSIPDPPSRSQSLYRLNCPLMRNKHEVTHEQSQFWTIPRSILTQITFNLTQILVSRVVGKVSLWQFDPPCVWFSSASILPPMLLPYISFVYEQADARLSGVSVFQKKWRRILYSVATLRWMNRRNDIWRIKLSVGPCIIVITEE